MKPQTVILIGAGAGILVAISLGGRYVYTKVQLAKLEGDAAERYGFPRWWFIALGLQETGLDPTAVNMTGGDKARGGSWGVNQISALTANNHGFTGDPKELLDPAVNTDWTGRILSNPLDRWGQRRHPPVSFSEAASMWNGGFYPGDEAPEGHKPLKDTTKENVKRYVASATGHVAMAESLA